MKKVICFIFVLFIGLKAEAKTYYSDYSESLILMIVMLKKVI